MNTDSLWLNIILFVVGLALLIKGSGWFVDGAAFVARRFHIPDIVIGLTLVSLGTSLPELATNVYASIIGEGAVGLGNVAGSNIANTLLILGTAAALSSQAIPVTRIMLHRDAAVMVAVYIVFAAMCYLPFSHPVVGRLDGVILLVIFAWYTWHLLRSQEPGEAASKEAETSWVNSLFKAVLVLVGGSAMVIFGARLMVDNVVWAATNHFHVPTELVSATVVAFGTSAPELAVTIAGIVKKKNDIAVGNVIGSNIYNLALIMGVTCTIDPVPVSNEMRLVLLPSLVVTGFLLGLVMRSGWKLRRAEGLAFIGLYITFIGVSAYRCMP